MTANTITMIDYGIGNYRSVAKGFEHVGATVELTADLDKILAADKLVLPGVGAFGATMDALRNRNQVEPIQAAVARGTPFLGICVGMQVLFDDSDEMGFHTGPWPHSGAGSPFFRRSRRESSSHGMEPAAS